MKRVLFICTANICRSPMAAGIFNALAEEQGLEASAGSAGVSALVGEPAAPHAHRVTGEFGINLNEHRARQVDPASLEDADLVLTMTSVHRDLLRREFDRYSGKVYTLPEYAADDLGAGIADPYGHNVGAYRASAREILGYIERTVERMKEERRGSGRLPN